MSKHRTTIALSTEAREGLESLFTALGWEGQRGAVLNAGLERLGLMASGHLGDTAEALALVEFNIDFHEAGIETIEGLPSLPEMTDILLSEGFELIERNEAADE